MSVRVDQSGKDGSVREINHSCVCGNLRVGSHARNLVALDHDRLPGERLAGLHVEHAPGANDHTLNRRRLLGTDQTRSQYQQCENNCAAIEFHSIPSQKS